MRMVALSWWQRTRESPRRRFTLPTPVSHGVSVRDTLSAVLFEPLAGFGDGALFFLSDGFVNRRVAQQLILLLRPLVRSLGARRPHEELAPVGECDVAAVGAVGAVLGLIP